VADGAVNGVKLFMRQQLTNILYKFTKPQLLQNLNELATHQWKSRDELQALQLSHLYQLLEYVKIHVPYYRDLFQQIGFDPRDFLPQFFLAAVYLA